MSNQESKTKRPILPVNTRMDASKYFEMVGRLMDDRRGYSLLSSLNHENVEEGTQRQTDRHLGAE